MHFMGSGPAQEPCAKLVISHTSSSFLKFLFHRQDFGRDNTPVIFTTEWNYLSEAHTRITTVIDVGNHMLPLRKLHLCNSTTIIVIQLTQLSKQEHNELTGAKLGITS